MSNKEGSPGLPEKAPKRVKYVKISELRVEGDQGACLRPLGLCELGGCCDICWYGGRRSSDVGR